VIKYEFIGSNGYHKGAKNLQDSTVPDEARKI
jgi:hypothetical protein